jgi:hypothetical protein
MGAIQSLWGGHGRPFFIEIQTGQSTARPEQILPYL